MPYCSRCGSAQPDGGRFCAACGQPLPVGASTPSLGTSTILNQQMPREIGQKGLFGRRRTWFGLAVLAIALVVAVGTMREPPQPNRPAAPTQLVGPPHPNYSYRDASEVVNRAIRDGNIRVTLFGRQNGVYIADRNAGLIGDSGLMGRDGKVRSDLCPANSWGVTMTIDQASPNYALPESSLPIIKQLDLWYCVDKYTGAIRPANDYARELTTGPWADLPDGPRP